MMRLRKAIDACPGKTESCRIGQSTRGAPVLADGPEFQLLRYQVPEPTTWVGASLAGLMLIVQIVRARAFSKRQGEMLKS